MRRIDEILEVVVKDVTEKREKWIAEGQPEDPTDGRRCDLTDWQLIGMWMTGEIEEWK